MKVLVTGAKGQLGSDVISELNKRRHIAIGADIEEMDITDKASVNSFIKSVMPDAVIHCAAWTNVDAAEEPENREKVFAVNTNGTRYIAEVCKEIGCKMMYISTDYVFDGQGEEPWDADCNDFASLNVYGESKLQGELAVKELLDHYFIVRTSWVFGPNGNNFIRTMLKLADKYDTIRVVNDQVGTPTYTPDLARLLVDMIETDKYGVYHASNEGGYISWYDFACEIFKQVELDTKVVPVTTEEYGMSKALRPYNSRLDKSKLEQYRFTRLPS